MQDNLWVEKYRPTSVNDYVFTDDRLKSTVEGWIANTQINNITLTGEPGTGKTSLAKLLINEFGIHEYDVMEINASRENGIDTIRNKIRGFVETMPFGDMKIVLLDEFDFMSPNAQAALRNDMEAYHSTVRFFLTANHSYKIIPAIKSRCPEFVISKPDRVDFTTRAATVLVSEDVKFDIEILDDYVRESYPDLRKCLNLLQINCKDGSLLGINRTTISESSLLVAATEKFKAGKILEGRQTLLQYLGMFPSRLEDIYVWMYNNLHLWGTTQQEKDAAVIIIRNGLANISLVGIPEISLSASLIELCQK